MEKKLGKMQIVKNLNCYSFFNEVQILSELEVKNYRIDFSELSGLFLVDEDDFTLPEKIYDVDKEFRELVLKSFNMNTRNTGVLLDGEKGFGKSVMAKQLAIQANLPVIMITKSIPVTYIKIINNRTTSLPLSKAQGTSIQGPSFFDSIKVSIDEKSNFYPYKIESYKQDPTFYMNIEISKDEFDKVFSFVLKNIMEQL